MDKREIIKRLNNIAEHAVHTVGEEPFVMSLDDGIAVHEAIELLKKPETNCSEIPNNSDTISRQAVTKFLNDWLSCLFENCHKQSASDLKMIIKDFKNLPSAQPEQRWIPCSERLPEIDKEVLVTDGDLCWVCSLFESQDIEDGLYQWEDNYGHWHDFETWVAWMPLPEPYQEGGEADE